MAKQHQVIKFVFADFRGEWNRTFSATAGVMYEATSSKDELAVVKEVPGTGTAVTYLYHFQERDEVAVIGDVIHIPARCIKSEQGNAVKCG